MSLNEKMILIVPGIFAFTGHDGEIVAGLWRSGFESNSLNKLHFVFNLFQIYNY